MPRIAAVNHESATGKAKQLLDAVQKKLGVTPNMMKTMAQSPAVLEAYLHFNGALAGGVLNAKVREQIAIAVAQQNQCDYCLSAHAALGKGAGLSETEIGASREAGSENAKTAAILRFAQTIARKQGFATDEDFAHARSAGLGDAEIAETIANVGLNVFTNYFNHAAGTEIDFPVVQSAQRKTA